MKSNFLVLIFAGSISLIFINSCYKLRGHYGTKSYEPVSRSVKISDIKLPEGYSIEMVSGNLNFPTSITFDDKGQLYVIEAGYSYGEIFTTPKLLRVEPNGKTTEIAQGEKWSLDCSRFL